MHSTVALQTVQQEAVKGSLQHKLEALVNKQWEHGILKKCGWNRHVSCYLLSQMQVEAITQDKKLEHNGASEAPEAPEAPEQEKYQEEQQDDQDDINWDDMTTLASMGPVDEQIWEELQLQCQQQYTDDKFCHRANKEDTWEWQVWWHRSLYLEATRQVTGLWDWVMGTQGSGR
eukprot:m51a1_g9873 hypothetical protein (174) ;mRNA; f:82876-95504